LALRKNRTRNLEGLKPTPSNRSKWVSVTQMLTAIANWQYYFEVYNYN